MLRYGWQTLRARKAGFVGALLALISASAMIVACGTLLETGLRGSIETERYAATPIIVGADQNVHQVTVTEKKGRAREKRKSKPIAERAWLPRGTADRLRDLPGTGEVIEEVTFPAHPVDERERVLDGVDGNPFWGHSWRSAPLTPFELIVGKAPTASDDVAVDRETADRLGLRPGDELTVQAARAPSTYRVTGVAAPRGGDLQDQSSLFFHHAEAERLSGRDGAMMAIGVQPADGVDAEALAEKVGERLKDTGAQVHTGADRGGMEFLGGDSARIQLISMGAAMGGTSLLVAILVVVGTYALSLQQRYRELALLRAVAATPRQLRQLIGREALLVGLAGGVTGALAGTLVARWLYGQFIRLGAVPENLELVVSPFPVCAAVGAALLCSWVAARVAVRRTARIRPTEALAEAAVQPLRLPWPRLVAGVVASAGGVVLLLVLSRLQTEGASTPVTFATVIVLAIAVSLLGPPLTRLALSVVSVPLRVSRVGGYLALANARSNARRMAAAITPLALLVGMACTVFFVQTTMTSAAETEAHNGLKADYVLTSSGPGVPQEAAQEVRRLDDVRAVTEVARTGAHIGIAAFRAQGVSPRGLEATWDPGLVAGSLDGFGERSLAVSESAADRADLDLGDTVEVTMADGTDVEVTVVAVYSRGLGFGDLTMSYTLISQHRDDPLAESVLVATDDAAPDRQALEQALAPYPGVRVMDQAEAGDVRAEVQQSQAEVNYLAMGLVIAFTAIAVVNTIAMTVSERRREFALMRLVGATRRQVRSMLRLEALIVVATAVALGSAIALAVLGAFSVGMTGSARPSIAPVTYLAVVASCLLLALLATMVSGRIALKVRPANAIGGQQ